jgi:uncharacterized membrane protein
MAFEIINLFATITFSIIIISDVNLSKDNETTLMTFQFFYLLLGNFVPLIILSLTLWVFKRIETFENPLMYFEMTIDNFYYRKIYDL